jgi:hypothetical protein
MGELNPLRMDKLGIEPRTIPKLSFEAMLREYYTTKPYARNLELVVFRWLIIIIMQTFGFPYPT